MDFILLNLKVKDIMDFETLSWHLSYVDHLLFIDEKNAIISILVEPRQMKVC